MSFLKKKWAALMSKNQPKDKKKPAADDSVIRPTTDWNSMLAHKCAEEPERLIQIHKIVRQPVPSWGLPLQTTQDSPKLPSRSEMDGKSGKAGILPTTATTAGNVAAVHLRNARHLAPDKSLFYNFHMDHQLAYVVEAYVETYLLRMSNIVVYYQGRPVSLESTPHDLGMTSSKTNVLEIWERGEEYLRHELILQRVNWIASIWTFNPTAAPGAPAAVTSSPTMLLDHHPQAVPAQPATQPAPAAPTSSGPIRSLFHRLSVAVSPSSSSSSSSTTEADAANPVPVPSSGLSAASQHVLHTLQRARNELTKHGPMSASWYDSRFYSDVLMHVLTYLDIEDWLSCVAINVQWLLITLRYAMITQLHNGDMAWVTPQAYPVWLKGVSEISWNIAVRESLDAFYFRSSWRGMNIGKDGSFRPTKFAPRAVWPVTNSRLEFQNRERSQFLSYVRANFSTETLLEPPNVSRQTQEEMDLQEALRRSVQDTEIRKLEGDASSTLVHKYADGEVTEAVTLPQLHFAIKVCRQNFANDMYSMFPLISFKKQAFNIDFTRTHTSIIYGRQSGPGISVEDPNSWQFRRQTQYAEEKVDPSDCIPVGAVTWRIHRPVPLSLTEYPDPNPPLPSYVPPKGYSTAATDSPAADALRQPVVEAIALTGSSAPTTVVVTLPSATTVATAAATPSSGPQGPFNTVTSPGVSFPLFAPAAQQPQPTPSPAVKVSMAAPERKALFGGSPNSGYTGGLKERPVKGVLEVLFLAVKSTHRGTHCGKALYKFIESQAMQLDAPIVYVEVGVNEDVAQTFWRSNGLKWIDGPTETYPVPSFGFAQMNFFEQRCLRFCDTAQFVRVLY